MNINNFSNFMDSQSSNLEGIARKFFNLISEILNFTAVDDQEENFISSMVCDLDKMHDLTNCLAGRCSEYHHQRDLIDAGIQDKIDESKMNSIFEMER